MAIVKPREEKKGKKKKKVVIEIEQEPESIERKMQIIKTKPGEGEKKVEMDKKKTDKIEKKKEQTKKKMEKVIKKTEKVAKKTEKVVKDMEKVEDVSKDDVVFSEPMILSTGESNLVYYPFRCVHCTVYRDVKGYRIIFFLFASNKILEYMVFQIGLPFSTYS